MKKNAKTDRYQFLQKEEAWIIQALVEIEKTQNPDEDETRVTNSVNRSLLIEHSDPFIDTFELFLEMTVKYEIEGMPESMTGVTASRWYNGVGNGSFFDLMKEGKDNFEKRRRARQGKRIKSFEKAAVSYEHYEDILGNAALMREIQELRDQVAILENQLANNEPVLIDTPVIQPTEHSFNDPDQFVERPKRQPSERMQRFRRVNKERREREISWLQQ